MTRFSLTFFVLGLATAALLIPDARGQRNAISASEALDLVSAQFGPRSVQWVAEMRARGGVPQPADWEVLAYDQRVPRLLYRFWASAGRVVDGGPDEERYPLAVPLGYFSPNQLGVDSVAAFTIAEGEARQARVAFDSCDYLLRVREYSTEPMWRLELFDSRQQIVGKIYISATSGAVMRTVWIYRDERAISPSRPRIVDSFAPSDSAPAGDSFTRTSPPAPVPNDGLTRTPPRSDPAPEGPRQPYRPVDPSGSAQDDGIPEPPPAPGGSGSSGQIPDLRDIPEPPASDPPEAPARPDPTRPPIDVPDSGSGSSERIPPPPIPR